MDRFQLTVKCSVQLINHAADSRLEIIVHQEQAFESESFEQVLLASRTPIND